MELLQQRVVPLNPDQANQLLTIVTLTRRTKIGANNFYWIAGLSIVNSFISAFGGSLTFVIGLGITQSVDALTYIFTKEVSNEASLFKGIGLVLSALICGGFALLGFFAGRTHRWAFITGIVLYAFDSVLMLVFQNWIGFIFHLYFLWGLWNGLRAINQLQEFNATRPGLLLGFPKNIGIL